MLPLHGRLALPASMCEREETVENPTVYDHFIAWMISCIYSTQALGPHYIKWQNSLRWPLGPG